ncbi:MAG: triacylglycerol lipase [Actinomycetota bacterium]|nr:triacylglycerol lipase [Actinomycetota bacterium]
MLPPPPAASAPRRRGPLIAMVGALAVVVVVVAVSVAIGHRGHDRASATADTSSAAPTPAAAGSPVASPTVTAVASAPVTPSPSPSPVAPPGPRPPDNQPGPIILVPGFGGSDEMLAALAQRLRNAGRTTILLAIPNNATGDLRSQAALLGARVAGELKAGAPSVDLVGYSAGGLVVALFVADHPQDVRRAVAIGAPFHGTNIAGLAAGLVPSMCPTACQQMVPGSPLLPMLDAAQPARSGVPWMSMWTAHDQIVQPADSARFAGADNIALQNVCADDAVTHIDLPADPLVAGLTLKALGVAAMPSPSASDCSGLRSLGAG